MCDQSLNYGGQVPMPQARIDFFRQGATVSSASVTIANSSSGTVNVYALGALLPGDNVRAGIVGPLLTVTATDPSTNEVTLSNASGASVTLEVGTRLVDLSSRPTVYADNLGLASVTNPVIADSGGRATVFLPDGAYDYLVTGGTPVSVDTTQTTTTRFPVDSLTWNHDPEGASRILLVALAWQTFTVTETVDSVTFNGVEMTRVVSNPFLPQGSLDVFAMVDPPTGSHEIAVKFSGSETKGVAAASVSLKDASQSPALGVVRSGTGSTSPASTSVTDTLVDGLVLAFLAVNTAAGTTTVTATGGVAPLWNFQGGTTGDADRTLHAAGTLPGNGDHVDPSWTISPARPWGIAGVEVFPAGSALHTDVTGTPCSSVPYGINASDYPSLQAAIDALSSQGVVVYIPAGTYRLRDGLVISKPNVTLIGEGVTTIITPDDPTNHPVDLLTVRAMETRLYRMKFDGAAAEQDLDTGTSCIVFDGYDGPLFAERLVQHCHLEEVIATGASKYGWWLRDTLALVAINCEVVENKGTGMRIQGTDPHGSCNALRFIGCAFSHNGGLGVDIGDPVVPPDTIGTGQAGETFIGCIMELNQGDGYTLAIVGVSLNAQVALKLEVLSCYFEAPAEGAAQFLRFENCPNVTVDNCNFAGDPGDPSSGPDRAVSFVNCSYARASNNVAQGFKTEIIKFDGGCKDCVEFCNRDFDTSTVASRITIDSDAVVVATSRRSLGLPTFVNDGARPTASDLPAGSMIWVVGPTAPNKNLQVSNGASWVSI